jgi:gentisate 1,2-dioxygenase
VASGDTFSVPRWTRFEHAVTTDAQLFSMSDEPLMRFSRFHRFEAV